LKRYIIGFLIIVILISAISLIAFFLIHSHINFLRLRNQEIENIEEEMMRKLDNFTFLIQPFEQEVREFNEEVVFEIYREIGSGSGGLPLTVSNTELVQLVEKYNFVDVYLIDHTGTIVRSSFIDDIGLNLLDLEQSFADFIRDVYGSGKVSTQRLGLSNMSGTKMMYSYFSPTGSDWIIEISVDFEGYMRLKYSDELSDFLFHDYFYQLTEFHTQLEEMDIIYCTSVSARSFLTGEEVQVGAEVIGAFAEDRDFSFRKGDNLSIYIKRTMKKQEFDFVQYPILYLAYDLAYYRIFMLKVTLISLIAAVLFTILLSRITYRMVERKLVERIEELAEVLQYAAEGDYSRKVLYSSKIPEMMKLARSTNQLVEKVRDREKRLKQALDERETLLREINHRVKNNLNVVVSLLNLQEDQVSSVEDAREALQKTRNRIYSMALTHEKLYQSENFAEVKMKPYIEDLVANIRNFREDHRPIRIETRIEEISLPIRCAIPCGIIINELLTNAFTHAFPQETQGWILVRLCNDSDSRYNLSVEDSGVGLPENFSLKSLDSLGMILVRTLADQLQGELIISSETGARFEVRFSPADT